MRGLISIDMIGISDKLRNLIAPGVNGDFSIEINRGDICNEYQLFQCIMQKWHAIRYEKPSYSQQHLHLSLWDNEQEKEAYAINYDLTAVMPPEDLQIHCSPMQKSRWSGDIAWCINVYGDLDADASNYLDELQKWWEFMTALFTGDGFLRATYYSEELLLITKREDAFK